MCGRGATFTTVVHPGELTDAEWEAECAALVAARRAEVAERRRGQVDRNRAAFARDKAVQA